MDHKTAREKKEIMARIKAFSPCGFSCRLSSNISYFKSFVGKDFKALMQMALFVLPLYFKESEKKCWFLLAKVSFCFYATSIVIVLHRFFVCHFVFYFLLMIPAIGEVYVQDLLRLLFNICHHMLRGLRLTLFFI